MSTHLRPFPIYRRRRFRRSKRFASAGGGTRTGGQDIASTRSPPLQSGNKIQQIGKTQEKPHGHNSRAVAGWQASVSHRGRRWIGLLSIVGLQCCRSLRSRPAAPSLAEVTITPAERCCRLSRQVDDAIKAKAADKQVAAVSVLQKKGVRLCEQYKRAQGIRHLAKALKLLGVKPIDID